MKNNDAVGTSSWHHKICQKSAKKKPEDIMKSDSSHDIINKVLDFVGNKDHINNQY